MNKYQLEIIAFALSRVISQMELNLIELSEDDNLRLTDVQKVFKVVLKQLAQAE
jgi:hypothetical protein